MLPGGAARKGSARVERLGHLAPQGHASSGFARLWVCVPHGAHDMMNARDRIFYVALPPVRCLLRIAVASMEGAYINHGLHASEQFFVFDVSLSGISFVEKRENRYRDAVSSPKTLQGIAETLRDCKVVCCTQAGADAVEYFGRHGVEMEMSEGPIDEKLKGFIESVF